MIRFEILKYLEDHKLLEEKNIYIIKDSNIIKDMVIKNLLKISMSDILKLECEEKRHLSGVTSFYDIVITKQQNSRRIMYGLYTPKKYQEIEDFWVDINEYKNYKRTKLIDKILNESAV